MKTNKSSLVAVAVLSMLISVAAGVLFGSPAFDSVRRLYFQTFNGRARFDKSTPTSPTNALLEYNLEYGPKPVIH